MIAPGLATALGASACGLFDFSNPGLNVSGGAGGSSGHSAGGGSAALAGGAGKANQSGGQTSMGGAGTGGRANSAGSSALGGTAGSSTLGGSAGSSASGGSAGSSALGGTAGKAAAGGASAGQAGASAAAGASAQGGAPGEPPSCAGLSSTACNGDDCCTTLPVPGCNNCAFPDGYVSTVSDFLLDKYEVTVGRFRNFMSAYPGPPAANAGAHPAIPGSGWQTSWNGALPTQGADLIGTYPGECPDFETIAAPANDILPINCVTWYAAFAFCAWDGGFLPTELEWQYAAAGGIENRLYAWPGTALNPTLALYGYCGNGISTDCATSDILPVGSKPLGVAKWGQMDITGSMWEWVLDNPTGSFPPASPCNNCAHLASSGTREIRGASWFEDVTWLPTDHRGDDPPESSWKNVGIRCARSPH